MFTGSGPCVVPLSLIGFPTSACNSSSSVASAMRRPSPSLEGARSCHTGGERPAVALTEGEAQRPRAGDEELDLEPPILHLARLANELVQARPVDDAGARRVDIDTVCIAGFVAV